MTFFALGYEHSIVNMYVIPAGMLLGAPISLAGWWLWNQIPVTLGNMLAGTVFTGVALYVTYGRRRLSQLPEQGTAAMATGKVFGAGAPGV
jgi:formate/nitrite transporter FocA (FNT family)